MFAARVPSCGGGLVGRDHHTGSCGGGFADELKRGRRASVGEEPASCAEDERVYQEHVLVDQVRAQERLDQLAATHDSQIPARLLPELGCRVGGIALEQRRVRPRERLAQRPRRDVLLGRVERVRERTVGLRIPITQHVLVAPPTEQQPAARAHASPKLRAHHLVVSGNRPTAVLEATAPILVGPAGGLHDTIERQVVDDDDPHRVSFPGDAVRIAVINHLTLDGVMQAPGRPDEDRRGSFEHGGWAVPRNDEVMGAELGARMGAGGGLLLGRRSYEDMLSYWNTQPDSPFTNALNTTQKYVASRTLREPLPWPNSTLLEGDAADAVAELRKQAGGDLGIMGSGELIQTLMRASLIDEYMLLIHPLVLGTGRRLFTDGSPPASLQLVGEATTTTTGVVIATYQPSAA